MPKRLMLNSLKELKSQAGKNHGQTCASCNLWFLDTKVNFTLFYLTYSFAYYCARQFTVKSQHIYMSYGRRKRDENNNIIPWNHFQPFSCHGEVLCLKIIMYCCYLICINELPCSKRPLLVRDIVAHIKGSSMVDHHAINQTELYVQLNHSWSKRINRRLLS